MSKVSRKQKKELASLAALRDAQTDFSDAPEVRDWSRAVVGRFYRPIKKSLTIRLDADVLAWLRVAAIRRESTSSCAPPWKVSPVAVEPEAAIRCWPSSASPSTWRHRFRPANLGEG
jgi:BrnA antitoxin of type II toxin-antitoxin system